MRRKHIEKHLRGKFSDWVKSIDDEKLRGDVMDGTIITGGAIASLMRDETVNDYDLYFKSRELTERVAEYYVAKFKEYDMQIVRYGYTEQAVDMRVVTTKDGRVMVKVRSAGFAGDGDGQGYKYFETISDPAEREAAIEGFVTAAAKAVPKVKDDVVELSPYRPVFITSNAITLSDGIQIVLRFYGKPSEIHANYDFEHAKCYWRSWAKIGMQLTVPKQALLCIIDHRLLYTGSRYPLASMFRVLKFVRRGWKCDMGQVLKIAAQINELDMHAPWNLMDQLIGMDIAYFMEVMDIIMSGDIKEIDATYLARIVDEVYGEI